MGRIQVVLDAKNETLLREKAKKKGDISKIINEALRKYLVKKNV